MNLKKNLFSLILVFSIVNIFAQKTRIGIIPGECAVPFAYLLDDSENFLFVKSNSVNELVEQMEQGFIDAVNLGTNIAVLLAEKSMGSVVFACTTQDMNFCVVSHENESNSVSFLSDLVDKNVCVAGNGIMLGFFYWILQKNSIPIGEGENCVRLVNCSTQSESCSLLLNHKVDAAVLTKKNAQNVFSMEKAIKKKIDLNDEYSTIVGKNKNIPVSVLVVRKQFSSEKSEEFNFLLQSLETSILKINRNPMETQKIIKNDKRGFFLNKKIARNIRVENYKFSKAINSQANIRRYVEVYNYNPEAIKLPNPNSAWFY